jgi:tetratricopeptide (TPR) repeat protein
MALLGARDADEFRYRLGQKGITHILFTAPAFLYVQTPEERRPEEVWRRARDWVQGSPASFVARYRNEAEGTEIFAVRAEPSLMAAYKLYLQARDAVDQGHLALGRTLLDASFNRFHLPSALNAYGTVCLLMGRDFDDARAALEEALELRPDFPAAAVNLARVYARSGARQKARDAFAQARAMAERHPESRFLLPVIDQESEALR